MRLDTQCISFVEYCKIQRTPARMIPFRIRRLKIYDSNGTCFEKGVLHASLAVGTREGSTHSTKWSPSQTGESPSLQPA